MKLALLILILSHLAGPGLAECPVETPRMRLEEKLKRLEAFELYAVNKGLTVVNGMVVKK